MRRITRSTCSSPFSSAQFVCCERGFRLQHSSRVPIAQSAATLYSRSRQGHSEVTVGSRWGHGEVTARSWWCHVGITMRSRQGHGKVTAKSRWGHGEIKGVSRAPFRCKFNANAKREQIQSQWAAYLNKRSGWTVLARRLLSTTPI